jgi:CubicO group peptidase (beta-lactamase class C family)
MGEATDEEPKAARSLSDLVPAFASKPLAFEPGSKWQYWQPGILTLGRIVEIVSGVQFEAFLRKRIFDPLGMKDTTFYLTGPRYRGGDACQCEGKQLLLAVRLLYRHPPTCRDHYPSNGGLFSAESVRMMSLSRLAIWSPALLPETAGDWECISSANVRAQLKCSRLDLRPRRPQRYSGLNRHEVRVSH